MIPREEVPEELLELAPHDLQNYCSIRYKGEGVDVPLEQFDPEDQALLLALYGNLDDLYRAWLGESEQREMPQVLALIQRLAQPEWARRCATLGNATNERTSASPETRRV